MTTLVMPRKTAHVDVHQRSDRLFMEALALAKFARDRVALECIDDGI